MMIDIDKAIKNWAPVLDHLGIDLDKRLTMSHYAEHYEQINLPLKIRKNFKK